MFLRFAFLQYTVDAVSLDDDDLATVAEDDGSLASQEEKSVIFSPQPTATATNLATVTNTLGKLSIYQPPTSRNMKHKIQKELCIMQGSIWTFDTRTKKSALLSRSKKPEINPSFCLLQ